MLAGFTLGAATGPDINVSGAPEPAGWLRVLRCLAGCALACALGAAAASASADDLDSKVAITKGALVLNRTSNTYDGMLTIRNTSATPIAAPLALTVKDISAPGVALYNGVRRDADGHAVIESGLVYGMLAPGAQVAVPLKFLNPKRLPFNYSVGVDGRTMDANNSTVLRVTVRQLTEAGTSPAGAGWTVSAGGIPRAVTDTSGSASFRTLLDTDSIEASKPDAGAGSLAVELAAGTDTSVELVANPDAPVYGNASLRVDQVQQLLLQPSAVEVLSLRFVGPHEARVVLADLASVVLRDANGKILANLGSAFRLGADGAIHVADPAPLQAVLANANGKLSFDVMASDANGLAYGGQVSLYMARNPVGGKLLPSPSAPKLNLGGVRLVGTILNTDVVVETVTDAKGNFEFPDLPYGNLKVFGRIFANGRNYYANRVISLAGPVTLAIPMLFAGESAP